MSEISDQNLPEIPQDNKPKRTLTNSQLVAVEADWASGKTPKEIEKHFRKLGYEIDLSDLPEEPYNTN